MTESIVEVLVYATGLYAVVGLLFAIAFVIRGVQRVDPAAQEAGWGFRVLIIPGVATFWPLMLRRWIADRQAPDERTAHRLRRSSLENS